MKRGFTLTEVTFVMAVVCLLAALTFPVFSGARKSAAKATCFSNLRQYGQAIAVYRENESASEFGTPAQMGLPPHLGKLNLNQLQCGGVDPGQHTKAGYWITWSDPSDETESANNFAKYWSRYVNYVGSAAVIVFDPNHQQYLPKSRSWDFWTVLGLQLDSSVVVRTRRGFPYVVGWWHR